MVIMLQYPGTAPCSKSTTGPKGNPIEEESDRREGKGRSNSLGDGIH